MKIPTEAVLTSAPETLTQIKSDIQRGVFNGLAGGFGHIRDMLAESFKAHCIRECGRFEPTRTSQDAITLAAQWLDNPCGQGLLIVGNVGCGKTALLEAIRRVINAGISALGGCGKIEWRTARDIAQLATENPDKYDDVINAPILAIDDLGEEDPAPKRYGKVVNPIANLILHRYQMRLFCTLATSNLESDERESLYGDRAEDRVSQMFRKLYFPGDSMRKRLSQIDPWQSAEREPWEDELDRMEADNEPITFEQWLERNPEIADVLVSVPRPSTTNLMIAYDASKAIHAAAEQGNAACVRLLQQSDRHFELRRMRRAKGDRLRDAENAARLKQKPEENQ